MKMKRMLLASLCLTMLFAGCGDKKKRKKEAWQKREQVYSDHPPSHWLEYMEKRDPRVRKAAGRMLVDYTRNGKDQVPALVEILKRTKSSGVRLDVVRTLGNMKSKAAAAVPALCDALKDQSWEHRDVAAETLGMIGKDLNRTTAALTAALTDSDERVRLTAARGLGKVKTGDSKAIAGLIKLLEDPDTNVQSEAALAFQTIGRKGKAAIPALQKAAKSQNFMVKFNAEEALRQMR